MDGPADVVEEAEQHKGARPREVHGLSAGAAAREEAGVRSAPPEHAAQWDPVAGLLRELAVQRPHLLLHSPPITFV